MFAERALVFLYGLTPAHPGTGQAVGAVDLPVQREVHTGLPLVQGSGVKGAWRERMERRNPGDPLVKVAFGPPTSEAHEYAGALAVTDARLLAFPVRSAIGLLAWATSPMVWERFARDAELAGLSVPRGPTVGAGAAAASGDSCLRDGTVVLEAYAFAATVDAAAEDCARWLADRGAVDPAMVPFFTGRLVFVEDDVLRDLTVHGAEVVARIALSEAGTTAGEGGNLWYEELIPSETLFYLLALASDGRTAVDGRRPTAAEVLGVIRSDDGEVVQLGGEATVGRGLFRVRVLGGDRA